MTTIYKYPLSITDEQTVQLPRGAVVLTVMLQQARLCLWAEVDPQAITERRTILIFGTGHAIPSRESIGALAYLSSVIDGQFVWHVFEKL
jgi:hypothetical protein